MSSVVAPGMKDSYSKVVRRTLLDFCPLFISDYIHKANTAAWLFLPLGVLFSFINLALSIRDLWRSPNKNAALVTEVGARFLQFSLLSITVGILVAAKVATLSVALVAAAPILLLASAAVMLMMDLGRFFVHLSKRADVKLTDEAKTAHNRQMRLTGASAVIWASILAAMVIAIFLPLSLSSLGLIPAITILVASFYKFYHYKEAKAQEILNELNAKYTSQPDLTVSNDYYETLRVSNSNRDKALEDKISKLNNEITFNPMSSQHEKRSQKVGALTDIKTARDSNKQIPTKDELQKKYPLAFQSFFREIGEVEALVDAVTPKSSRALYI